MPSIRPLSQHERDLVNELENEHTWVGEHGGRYYGDIGVKLEDAIMKKGTDFIADSTSGGTNLVPFLFDADIVTFPLLNAELFPFVTLKDIPSSNSVHTASLGNVTSAWGTTEGSGAPIALQTTDSLVASITSAVCDIRMAITVGVNLLNDTPVNLGQEIQELLGKKHAAELDRVIACGNGTTEPLGITGTARTVTYSAANSTAGPWKVSDFEGMVGALPKQYRHNEPSVCWLSCDALYFRARGIPVSTTDQRRIFGYNLDVGQGAYQFYQRPWRIQNNVAAASLAYLKLALYRMWRRKGLELFATREGQTLALNHEVLFTAVGRYAGKVVDANGVVLCTNSPLH